MEIPCQQSLRTAYQKLWKKLFKSISEASREAAGAASARGWHPPNPPAMLPALCVKGPPDFCEAEKAEKPFRSLPEAYEMPLEKEGVTEMLGRPVREDNESQSYQFYNRNSG